MLNQLFRQALEVGKQVRTETRIAAGPTRCRPSPSSWPRSVLDDLPGRSVLVIGAGRMAEATALALVRHEVREVVVANRTVGTARELAARVGGRGVGFDRLAEELSAADIVISSTDAPHAILREADLEPVMAARADRPMVIVDISVPRDVAAVGGRAGRASRSSTSTTSSGWSRPTSTAGASRPSAARGSCSGAVQGFSAWRRGLAPAPAITSLRARAEEIRRAELGRLDGQLGRPSPADRERVEALTKGIVNKLLHEPTVRVRAAADGRGRGLRHLESLRHLFGLEAPAGNYRPGGAPPCTSSSPPGARPLARAQTELVAAALRAAGHDRRGCCRSSRRATAGAPRAPARRPTRASS